MNKEKIKVLIADDHALIHEALAFALSRTEDFEVDSVSSLLGVETAIASKSYNVLLLDLVMPGMDGITSVERIVKMAPNTNVVVFSGEVNVAFLLKATEKGAKGFISKQMGMKSIANAIRLIDGGDVYVPISLVRDETISSHGGSVAAPGALTKLEMNILERVSGGKTNKQIAWDLQITEVNVKMYMRTICRKLNAKNRAHAAIKAREVGVLTSD